MQSDKFGQWVKVFRPSSFFVPIVLSLTFAGLCGFSVVSCMCGCDGQDDGKIREQLAAEESQAGDASRPMMSLDLGGGVTLDCVLIPAGKCVMGSPAGEKQRGKDEGPQRQVTISKPFYMGITEVTQEQYQAVMNSNPSNFRHPQKPVEQIFWEDAVEFCEKVSKKTGKPVRLPTEAEWEYACRGGTETPFNTGETINSSQANFDGTHIYGNGTEGEFRKKTMAVGSFQPNGFGLYDMHGNVAEWCSDWYQDSYEGLDSKDPQGPEDGMNRVLRGGSWVSFPGYCRSADRDWNNPGYWVGVNGFRVVVAKSDE